MILREPLLFIVIIALFYLLLVFVVLPIAQVFVKSIVVKNHFTLANYAAVFSKSYLLAPFLNSMVLGVATACAGTLVGFVFAYAVTRTALPGKAIFRQIATFPIVSPPFVVALAAILLFGRAGVLTRYVEAIIGKFSIYGLGGLIVVETIAYAPLAFLVLTGVLQAIDPALEEAAMDLGASRARVFATVTLPLAVPGLAAAWSLVFIESVADFGNPIMISGDFSVLATEAWLRVEGWGDVAAAAVLSSVLLIPSVIIFAFQRFWVGRRSYVTITGKIATIQAEPTKWYVRWPLFTFCAAVSVMILIVYVALVLGALVNGWGFDWSPTLKWVSSVTSEVGQLIRSLVFSMLAGAVSALFSMTAAYLVTRKRFVLRGAVYFVAILPAALPGIFLGIGYSISFTPRPVDLYGTAAIIVLAMVFWNISMGYQTGIGAMKQVSPSLGEAASNLGAGSMRIFREIEIPLLQGPFFSAFIVSFIRSITTLSVIVFLATADNSVATFTIMNLVSDGFYGKAAALTTLLLLISFVVLGAAKLLVGRKLDLFKV